MSFYVRPALDVARDLLGQRLVVEGAWGRKVGRIVEVEAYIGPQDLACHASRGRTERTEVLFGPAGHAYVYLIYGMYHLFNVVTEVEGFPAAVLVRAVEPVEGFAPRTRLDGPGRLSRAMGIDRRHHNRLPLDRPPIFVSPGAPVPESRIERGPRIGVEYAGPWAEEPFRLWERGNVHVSRAPRRR